MIVLAVSDAFLGFCVCVFAAKEVVMGFFAVEAYHEAGQVDLG